MIKELLLCAYLVAPTSALQRPHTNELNNNDYNYIELANVSVEWLSAVNTPTNAMYTFSIQQLRYGILYNDGYNLYMTYQAFYNNDYVGTYDNYYRLDYDTYSYIINNIYGMQLNISITDNYVGRDGVNYGHAFEMYNKVSVFTTPVNNFEYYDLIDNTYAFYYTYQTDNTHYTINTYNITKHSLTQELHVNDIREYFINDAYNTGYEVGYRDGVSTNNNLFTLIGSAFNGLVDFFNIEIIPGITLGLLVFAPLFIGVVLVLLKLLVK